MKPRSKNIKRVKLNWNKPVMLSNGVMIPKGAKLKLDELEKRLRENYATIKEMDLSDQYRLTNVVRSYLEDISGYIGPRERVRDVLEKVQDKYPSSSRAMLALISDVKTEKEAVDKLKEIIKGVPELHKRLVSKNVPMTEKAFIISQIEKRIEEKEGPILTKELDKAVHELGVKDVVIKPVREDDPSKPDFWLRKIELENNPHIKKIEEKERDYINRGGEVKDEIVYLGNVVKDYDRGDVTDEELAEELSNFLNLSMDALDGDREKLMEYLYKYDTTDGKRIYNTILEMLRVDRNPTNEEVDRKVNNLLVENKIDLGNLEKINPKRMKKVIQDASKEGIHIQEIFRVMSKKAGKKREKTLADVINKAIDEIYEPPDGMFM